MPKSQEIENFFYEYHASNLIECLEDVKKECRDNGFLLLDKCTNESSHDFLEIVLSNINIEKMLNTSFNSKELKSKRITK